MESEIKEYTPDIENLFIQFMLSDPTLYVRCSGIIRDSFFEDRKNRDIVKIIANHYTQYSNLPSVEQIKAITGKEVELIPEVAAKEDRWFLKEVELFCRYKALKEAIYASPELLTQGRYGEVEASVKAAVQTALVKDLGLDYYADPKARLESLKNGRAQTSTGWKSVDEKLYGGLNRGEITIFAGQSGAGKSLFLQNLAVNWAQAGMTVIYLSLELSEKLCAMRIDAMHTNYETREILKNIEDVHVKIRLIQQRSRGALQIKQLPNGCTANDIRAYIKEYEINSGRKVDAIMVDYLDLMFPTSTRISAENLFVKDKYVTEELRNLAVELDILCISASQLNRGSYEESDFGPNHIAGGISKVNTADNLIALFTSTALKEAGRYQIQFLKTRSSSGVGSRVDLAFDVRSLRITDLEEGADGATEATVKNLYDQLKRTSIVKSEEKAAVKKVDTTSNTRSVNPLEGAAALRALIRPKNR